MTRHTAVQPLAPEVREFLETPGLMAVVASLNPDGTPHQAAAWYVLEGDGIVINSKIGRRWPSNLMRDHRASVIVVDGYRWVSVRGEVEVIRDDERAHADIAALARRYHPDDPITVEEQVRQFESEERVTFVLRGRVAADLEE